MASLNFPAAGVTLFIEVLGSPYAITFHSLMKLTISSTA